MAKGYWGPGVNTCRCCQSGPKGKFWCRDCDHVIKAPHSFSPACPFCRQPMTRMGGKWRVGRKGRRIDYPRLHKPSRGEVLLAKLTGTYEQARKRWIDGWG